MKANHFNGFISLVFLTVLFFVGVLGFLLAADVAFLHFRVLEFFQQISLKTLKTQIQLYSGICLFLSLFSFLVFYWVNRKSYYQVSLDGELEYSLNRKILNQFFENFFKKNAPKESVSFDLFVRKHSLELILDLSKVSMERHEELLKRWEKPLIEQIKSSLGVSSPVTVSVLCQKS